MAKKVMNKKKDLKGLFLDALGIAVVKNVEERLTAPFIGNGTFGSAIVKGIAGVGIPMIAGDNKLTRITSTAFIVDSMEDVVNAVFRMLSGADASTDVWN